MPRVAVIGAGCIGQWVGGHLASAGVDVVLAGRSVLRRTTEAGKLRFTDIERDASGFDLSLALPGSLGLEACFDMEVVLLSNDFDAVFVCLKIHDNHAAAILAALKRDTVIITLQNGVDNQRILSNLLPHHTVVAGMVPYGVVEVSPGYFRRGTYGALAFTDDMPETISSALRNSGLAVELYKEEDMRAVQWFKLVVNLQNALNALVGQPLETCMRNRAYRSIMAAAWEEALTVAKAMGIRLQGDINGQPIEKAAKLLRLPDLILKVAKRVKGVKPLDPSYHSSMFYDLEQRRKTEINELNERITSMAKSVNVDVPVNKLLSRLVVDAQDARQGSPRTSIEELVQKLEAESPGTLPRPLHLNRWLLAGTCVAGLAFGIAKL